MKASFSDKESTIRATARRAATIFQPPMLPERSNTKITSRGLVLRDKPTGGTKVNRKVPSLAPGASGCSSKLVPIASLP